MADEIKISAERRTEFGKGAARRIRAAHKIPAVIYGHGTEPQHITLPGHETMLVIRKANAVLTLDIEGQEQLALVKDVQKDPVRQVIEHLDLIVVQRGEKVAVDVPVHLEGEPFAGTIATLEHATVTVEAEAMHIPERLTIDIEDATDGTQWHAKDIVLPAGVALASDGEILVAHISTPAAAAAAEEAEGAAESAQ